ncbi:MAG: hypothetical protein WDM78_02215 [Puia sp.]
MVYDTIHKTIYVEDTAQQVSGEVSVLDFGAHAGAPFDNSIAFDAAIAYVIKPPRNTHITNWKFQYQQTVVMAKCSKRGKQILYCSCKGVYYQINLPVTNICHGLPATLNQGIVSAYS